MTTTEAHVYITHRLQAIYETTEAEAISELVLEHLSGATKPDRIRQPAKMLTAAQSQQLDAALSRLLLHEPVQYVLNEAWFCGLKFYVDHRVLIPRPETEELVEWIIAHCRFPIESLHVLDVGSGSGCIPIALKRRLGKAEVQGCEVSTGALDVARQNARNIGVAVSFREMDFLDDSKWQDLPVFDIIVSNPPYVPRKDRESMHPNVLDYEPECALFVPDNDALLFYRALARFGQQHLAKGGSVYAEIHESLGAAVLGLFHTAGYRAILKKDMQGKERMVKADR